MHHFNQINLFSEWESLGWQFIIVKEFTVGIWITDLSDIWILPVHLTLDIECLKIEYFAEKMQINCKEPQKVVCEIYNLFMAPHFESLVSWLFPPNNL